MRPILEALGWRAFEREGRLPPQVVRRRLQEDEDLGDGGGEMAVHGRYGQACP
jgi:hypothetical protein